MFALQFLGSCPDVTDPGTFFFLGGGEVFIVEVSILKKTTTQNTEPTLPKVFKTVALNTRFFFWP